MVQNINDDWLFSPSSPNWIRTCLRQSCSFKQKKCLWLVVPAQPCETSRYPWVLLPCFSGLRIPTSAVGSKSSATDLFSCTCYLFLLVCLFTGASDCSGFSGYRSLPSEFSQFTCTERRHSLLTASGPSFAPVLNFLNKWTQACSSAPALAVAVARRQRGDCKQGPR